MCCERGKREDREATCPVCRMAVDPSAPGAVLEGPGKPVLFCNARCRDRFLADPERYLSPVPA